MAQAHEKSATWRELRGTAGIAPLAIVCFGVWLHAADSLLVATMMPRIVADIGGARLVAWTIALYEVGAIVAGVSAALLSLRYGLRRAMVAAALIYMAGCVVSAAAPVMPAMLVGRLAQGTGGGGLMALSLVAVSRLFPHRLMPPVMAAVSAFWGISAFFGPLVGGLFADAGLWRGGFWFFAAQAAALAGWIAATPVLKDGDAGQRRSSTALPAFRLGVLSVAIVAVALGGIETTALGAPACVVVGLLLLALFLRLDGRQAAGRLLPPRPLDPRNPVGAGLLAIVLFSAAAIPLAVYGPLLLAGLHGISGVEAGYVLAAESVAWSLVAVLAVRIPRHGEGVAIAIGLGIVVLGVAGLVPVLPYGPLWLVVLLAAFLGGGFGMAWTFILGRLTAIAPAGETERVAGALTTLQQLGYAFGAGYCGIAANAAGLKDHMTSADARNVGVWVFAAALPLAVAGLGVLPRFLAGARP